MSGTTRSSVSGRCVRCGRTATMAWCWKSPSRGSTARPDTNPASPCAFPAFHGCAGTSRPTKPTASRRCKRCSTARVLRLDRDADLVDVDRLALLVEIGIDGDGSGRARVLVGELHVEQIFVALLADRV